MRVVGYHGQHGMLRCPRQWSRSKRVSTPPLRMTMSCNEDQMQMIDSVVAVYEDHPAAELAVKKLAASGFEMKSLSVVGSGVTCSAVMPRCSR